MDHEAIVVGGGIVGSSVAYHLARAGIGTVLVDRADNGRATDAGAGILSPATSSREQGADWERLAITAGAYYPELVESLEADGVDPDRIGYGRPGTLRVAIDDEEVAAFDRLDDLIETRSERYESVDERAIERLSPAEARDRCPALGNVKRALFYRNGARVDGQAFASALRTGGVEHGLRVRDGTVEAIRRDGDRVTGVRTADEAIDAGTVVIAGGAWSGSFGADLDTTIPIDPKRGQIAHLAFRGTDRETGETNETGAWPIVSAFRHHYIVPWPEGRVACGATREAGSGFAPHATAGGVHEVLGEALRVAPGLGRAGFETVRAGLRPVSADGDPVFGAIPGIEGAYVATGHGPSGLLLGPYSGKCVADLVRGVAPDVPIDSFGVGRFD